MSGRCDTAADLDDGDPSLDFIDSLSALWNCLTMGDSLQAAFWDAKAPMTSPSLADARGSGLDLANDIGVSAVALSREILPSMYKSCHCPKFIPVIIARRWRSNTSWLRAFTMAAALASPIPGSVRNCASVADRMRTACWFMLFTTVSAERELIPALFRRGDLPSTNGGGAPVAVSGTLIYRKLDCQDDPPHGRSLGLTIEDRGNWTTSQVLFSEGWWCVTIPSQHQIRVTRKSGGVAAEQTT